MELLVNQLTNQLFGFASPTSEYLMYLTKLIIDLWQISLPSCTCDSHGMGTNDASNDPLNDATWVGNAINGTARNGLAKCQTFKVGAEIQHWMNF